MAIKNEEANKLIAVVGAETEKVSKQKGIADEEEQKVKVIKEDVTKKQEDCARDLEKAEPALVAAEEALKTLNRVRYGCKSLLGYSVLVIPLCDKQGVYFSEQSD